MKYIARRLSVSQSDGRDVQYSDIGFFSLDGPLVVLGEPGLGKSEMVRQLAKVPSSILYKASTVLALPSFPNSTPRSKIIIDGLDEVATHTRGLPIAEILSKINHDDISNFVLTCRAVDWQHSLNVGIIQDRWKKIPVVGKLLPLSDSEIIEFVNENGDEQSGSAFFESAAKHNAIDLLRNPQTLIMLLKVTKKTGWPKTRTELYREACKLFIEEFNPTHRSINRGQQSQNLLLDGAGFICAQLILANKESVSLEGSANDYSIQVGDLCSNTSNDEVVKDVLSSKIFRMASNDSVEPCHRTVAEFLAGAWLANALRDDLSLRRLESLLYAHENVVPPALRGLHAWIATLGSSEIRDTFIPRDPYGIFRYGDAHEMSVEEVRILLTSLQDLSDIDPYFRSEDWHATFGKGLVRPELKDDILSLIRNPETPYQLIHLVLESVKGEPFADSIADDLLSLLLMPAATYVERRAALEALMECNDAPDWNKVINQLRVLAEIQSLRLALEIIELKTELFSGLDIAKVLITLSWVSKRGAGPRYAGLGYGLHLQMDDKQLNEALAKLSKTRIQGDIDDEEDQQFDDDAKEWIFSFLNECFNRDCPPNPELTWSLLNTVKRYSYYKKNEFHDAISNYFKKHPEFRQSVQKIAFETAKGENSTLVFFHLREASYALTMREEDIVVVLNEVVANRNKKTNWVDLWKSLILCIKWNPDFKGDAIAHARHQASALSELLPILEELEKPIVNAYEIEERKSREKWERRQSKENRKRHESYQNVKDQITSGKRVDVVSHIAKVYLGWFIDNKADTAEARVELLVGTEMVEDCIRAFSTTVHVCEIPDPQEMSTIRAAKKQEYYIEPILIAYCSMIGELVKLPDKILESTLAACRWGIRHTDDTITPEVQGKLENLVFKNTTQKAKFVRATIEPFLENNHEHISGLYRIIDEETFSDIAGDLTREWISRYKTFSTSPLKLLLKGAIKYGTPEILIPIVIDKIENNLWSDEEQHGLWIATLFLLNFDHSKNVVENFAKADVNRFWAFKDLIESCAGIIRLDASQNHFIVSEFGTVAPPNASPPSGFVGSKHPWEANQFINDRIKALSADPSEESSKLLKQLTTRQDLNGYLDFVKHSYALQLRLKAEIKFKNVSLAEVRSVLLSKAPMNHLDLQSFIIDQLQLLQRRLKDGPTNDYVTFWNGDTPQAENYCRDRIVGFLNPYLERYSVRAHTEGTMPNNKRCDFLNTCLNLDLPVEIKGQWHPDVWTSALDQLEGYSKEYRADGFGIYLVVWFGVLEVAKTKNPTKYATQPISSIEEFRQILDSNNKGLSEKTRLFVLDVSKP